MRPKQNARIHRPEYTTERTLFSAARTTDTAIADSTSRDGRLITPSAANESVIECAIVKAVTTLNTSVKATLKLGAADHVLSGSAERTSTAGSRSESRNRMWSNPVQMCSTPSFK